MGAITLDYVAPDCDLRDFISIFYDFSADVPVFEDDERADLAQLRFKLSPGPARYRFADGNVQDAPEIQIIGPTTGMTHVRAEGPVAVFGAGLLPAGWGALMGIEASTVVNRVIDATAIFGSALDAAAARLRAAPSLEARRVIGNEIVHALVANARETPFWFTRTVDQWLENADSPEVGALVASTNLSRRQVERYCKRFYGSPPKVLARKYRALRAAVSLARGDAALDDVLERGFYDQSHFIREIKHFTGVTPKKFAEDLPTLARLTLKRREMVELRPLVIDT